jgi:hypothetical protein
MQQQTVGQITVLNYQAASANHQPRRVWVLGAFFAVVVLGEMFGIERLYRWPWPLPGDYALASLLLVGAIVSALVTNLPGWLLGLYGLVGMCFFYPGEMITREFHFGIAEPGAIRLHVIRWSCALVVAWLVCRSTVLLRRKRPAP